MNLEADLIEKTCSSKECISTVLNTNIAEQNIYLTPTVDSLTYDCVYKPVEPLHNIQCPYCGKSYYMENYTTITAVYYPPIYKDGVNINPDRNQSTTYCTCLNCGKEFTY